MALPAAKQPINDDQNLGGPAAANDDLEIKNIKVSGDGNPRARIEGKKIKLGFELNIPGKAANDNIEIPKEKISSPENKPASKQVASQPKTDSEETPTNIEPQEEQNNSSIPQKEVSSLPEEQPANQEETEKSDEQQPTPAQQPNEQQPQQEQPNGQEQKQDDAQNQTGLPEKNPDEPAKTTEPAEGLQSDGQTPNPTQTQNPDNKEPQKLSPNEDLANTGPHPTNESKTPATVAPADQNKTASNLKSKGFGGALMAGMKTKSQAMNKTPEQIPKNSNKARIVSNIQSDQSRKEKLGQQRRKLESSLDQLEGKMDGVNASRYMQRIRFWFPSVYSSISGLGSGIKNSKSKGETKVAMLQSKLLAAKTIKATLKSTEAVSVLVEANIKAVSWIATSLETVIIPIILILIYPVLIILLDIFISCSGALGAPITKSIIELRKSVEEIIEGLEKVLKPEVEKIKKRREIQNINRLMAASSRDRKLHLQQQKEQEEYEESQRQQEQEKNKEPQQQNNSQPTP